MDNFSKKILIVVDSIDVNDSSGSKVNVALIQNLQKLNFNLVVYHYSRKEIKIKGVECVFIPEIRYSMLFFLSRIQRKLTQIFNWNLATFLENRFGYSFTYLNDVKSIKKSLLKVNFDFNLVITLSKGGSFRPHYVVLQFPELHQKWLAYIHDPFPMNCYPRPYNWVEPGYFHKMAFFTELASKAKYPAFPSELLKEWMASYFKEFYQKGLVIPHQSSEYDLFKEELPAFFDQNKFNLLHAGNLLKQRCPKGLIEGYLKFLNRYPEAKEKSCLLLIGDTASEHNELLSKYNNNNNIVLKTENVSFNIVYNLQRNSSVNIIIEAKFFISPFLPGKFPHCIEANNAILHIGPKISEVNRLMGKDYKYTAETNNSDVICEIIGELYQLWKINPQALKLNRADIEYYLSVNYLNKIMNQLF